MLSKLQGLESKSRVVSLLLKDSSIGGELVIDIYRDYASKGVLYRFQTERETSDRLFREEVTLKM